MIGDTPLRVGDVAYIDLPEPVRVVVLGDRGLVLRGRRMLTVAFCAEGDEPADDALRVDMPEDELHRQIPPPWVAGGRDRPAA